MKRGRHTGTDSATTGGVRTDGGLSECGALESTEDAGAGSDC